MDVLFNHRSIRRYKSDEIPEGLLHRIIEAGTRASTTGNMQLYSVVITRNAENKARLLPLHFNQVAAVEAPVMLTVCADMNRFNRWCEFRNADAGYDNLLWVVNSIIDASLFAQNICIAAESQGLGICYLGTALYNAAEIIDVLNLPGGVIPVTTITMGYPSDEPALTDRLPVEAVVHYETYKDYTSERIDNLFREKESLESSVSFVEENKKENLAQVFTDVRYTTKDNIFYSKKLLEVLKDQGFVV